MKIVRIDGAPIDNLDQAGQVLFAVFSAERSLTVETLEGELFELPAAVPLPRSWPVHPTQIYSSVHAALLSWVLWSFYPFRRRDGEVTALMLTIYPISRFC